MPGRKPALRVTFAAPIFPLPVERISGRPIAFTIRNPKATEPSKYARTERSQSALAITPLLLSRTEMLRAGCIRRQPVSAHSEKDETWTHAPTRNHRPRDYWLHGQACRDLCAN